MDDILEPTVDIRTAVLRGFVISNPNITKRLRIANDMKIVVEREFHGWWDIVSVFEIIDVDKAIQYFSGN